MATTTEKFVLGSVATLLTGGNLQALANNALVAGATFDNTQGQTGDGYTLCDLELYLDGFASAVTASTGFSLWMLAMQDGTNAEDGSASVTPAKAPSQVFPLRPVSTAQKVNRPLRLPWGKFTPLIKSDGTGQTLNNNTNSYLKIRPVSRQAV